MYIIVVDVKIKPEIILFTFLYTDDEDFIPLEITVEFLPGETMKNLTISIIDDDDREGSESFVVLLSNPSSGLLIGIPSVLSVTITADDLYIEFNQTSYTVNEGEEATITVMLNGDTFDSRDNVVSTVDVITANGLALGILNVL